MKILYISLAGDEQPEDISLNPNKYGGSAVVPRALKNFSDLDFWYAGSPRAIECFTDKEDKSKFIPLSPNERQSIYQGVELLRVIPTANSFDLIIHAQTNCFLNTPVKQALWAVGFREIVHQSHKHLLLFQPTYQQPQLNSQPYIYKFTLGVDVPPKFKQYKKEEFGLIVGNQRSRIQSAVLAEHICHNRKFKIIFAGPIDKDYKEEFLHLMDGEYAVYMGEITQKQKIELNKRAKCVFQLHLNPTCATLVSKEALSYGTPVLATPIGEWPEFIISGVNGFIIRDYNDLIKGIENSSKINQKDCYDFVKQNYSTEEMVRTLKDCFAKILSSLD